jgi:hypothetical protein
MNQSERSGALNRAMAVTTCLLILLLFVDGAVSYVQMWISGGRIPVPSAGVKLLLATVALAYVLHVWMSRRSNAGPYVFDEWITRLVPVFLVYLIVHMILSSASSGVAGLLEYNSLYSVFAILFLLAYAAPYLDATSIARAVVVAACPLALFAVVQFLMNKPLVYVNSIDGWFRTNAWMFFGKVRGFSLFTSPASCGAFMVFASLAALAFARGAKRRRTQLMWCALALLPAAAVLVTLHRHSYIHLAVSALALLFWRPISRHKGLALFLPVVLSIALYAVMLVPVLLGPAQDGLSSVVSMRERVYNTDAVSRFMFGGGIERILFGAGMVQRPGLVNTFPVLVDNSFMAVALHTGAVGMSLAVLVFAGMWTTLMDSARTDAGPLAQAVLCYWIVWPFGMSLEILFIPYVLTWLLFRMGSPVACVADKQKKTGHRRRAVISGVSIVLYTALIACMCGLAVDRQAADARMITRSRLKVLQRMERICMSSAGRYCGGIDTLMSLYNGCGLDDRVLFYKSFAAPEFMARDSIRCSPYTGKPYVVVVDSTGLKYQIRDPGGSDYISSWTNELEFDRASWE